MKKLLILLTLTITTALQAQAPQGFNYQATVRNSAGDLIVNTNVYFKFNVIQGSQTAVPIFTETHYVPTDDLGQVNLVIGQGTANTGIFSELDWSLGSYYLGIELDTGSGYLAMGTTQLLSVPYALYAENSGNNTPTTPNLETVLAENNSAGQQQIKDLLDPTDAQDAVTFSVLLEKITELQNQLDYLGDLENWSDSDGDGFTELAGDCNDLDASIRPGIYEVSDGIDNNCDGQIDEGYNGFDDVIDIDGNNYNFAIYGDQVWTVENAKMVTYRDGTPIPQVTDNTAWENPNIGAWAYYDNDPTKPRLYNWYAVMGIHDTDPNTPNKEFAPEGWHVPSDSEWTTLENYLIANGYNYDQTTTENKIAKAMASTTGWESSTASGTIGNDQSTNNSSGFNAFPDGIFYSGDFIAEGEVILFWSSDESNAVNAWTRLLGPSISSLNRDGSFYKRDGFSVRFVKGSHPNNIDDDNDGYTENQGDCDDTNATVYPGATELEDGIDNDCDDQIDEGFESCTPETAESYSAANVNMTFQTDPSADFISDGAGFSWVNNPDFYNAVNNSCKVAQVVRGNNNPWDNNQYDLDAKLDFNANTGFKIKVWSSRPNTEVRLKLEEIGNAGNNTEQFLTTSITSGWEELTFPFTAADSNKFNKIVLFFDLNTTSTDTYYFDDLRLYGDGSGGGGNTGSYNLTLPIDFETSGHGANWTWNVFENDTNPPLEFVANPNASGINTSATVAKITALQTGNPWAGTETAHGEMGITWDLSASNAIIKVMVYKTVISDVGVKLVNPSGGAQVEIKVENTVVNAWEELTFDFTSRIGNGLDGSTNIDQIVVFPDFDMGGRTSDNVIYFDNITFQ